MGEEVERRRREVESIGGFLPSHLILASPSPAVGHWAIGAPCSTGHSWLLVLA
jgi:hypothetical protein